MSDVEETPAVRKTRSGRAVKTPAKPKASPKPAGRKTRKKVVVMEVEVTDDEDMEQSDEPVGKKAKLEEDQLLEESDNENVEENKNEDALLNSGDEADKKNETAVLIMNDIEMLEEVDEEPKKKVETICETKIKNGKTESTEEVSINKIEDEPKTEKSENKKKEKELIEQKPQSNQSDESNDVTEKVDVNDTKLNKKASDETKEKAQDTKKSEELEIKPRVKESKKEELVIVEDEENSSGVEENDEVLRTDTVKSSENVEKTETVKQSKEDVKVKSVKHSKEEAKTELTKQIEEERKTESIKIQEEAKPESVKQTKDEAKIESIKPNKSKAKTESVTDEPEDHKVIKSEAVVKDEGTAKDEATDDANIEKEEDKEVELKKEKIINQNGDPEAENISDDELPGVPVAKVPETEEVSDEELPGPKRAELPADTEVVSEDELPTTKKDAEDDEAAKKDSGKRKLSDGDYDPTSPTSENEAPSKKSKEDKDEKEKDGDSKTSKPKKLPELDKYWKAVNDDPTDFTGWTYLLQYVDQENDMEAAREAYDAFLSHYPYCYGYWRKYADYEKRKGNKKKCEEVFERGLKAIPLSVDLWIHYLTYVKSTRGDDEEYVRSQFERALTACGLEFRSDRLWDSYIKWETEGKRLQKVTVLFDRLLTTPTQGYTTHFDNFQEHVSSNTPNKILEVDEFLALRKEVRNLLKDDDKAADNADMPPGDEDSKLFSSDEETKGIRERIVSIRRKAHKNTVNAVTARWNFEEGIKRPYFHVKPLERCQLKNWQEYLDYEIEQGDRVRIIVLFERCLIACALYEEFWLKFVHYLESLKDPELQPKIRDVYERACTIHHLKKPNLHLQWAIFEEACDNVNRAAEILVNLEKQVPNVLQVAYRRINLERRRSDNEKCSQLFEHYIGNSKNKMISSTVAIKYSRFCLRVLKDFEKAQEALRTAISKDPNNPRLYLQLIDLILQTPDAKEDQVCAVIEEFLEKETADPDQKALFAQRKLEFLEDFGTNVESVQAAYEQYQKFQKFMKESSKKKEPKSENTLSSKSKEKPPSSSTSQSASSASYPNYNYSGSSSTQPTYPYSGAQQGQYNYQQYGQGDQYQYQNWQYPQGGYGGYNQWGGYGGGYSY